jgi:hypothetical protein
MSNLQSAWMDMVVSTNPDDADLEILLEEASNIEIEPFLADDPLDSDHKPLPEDEEDHQRKPVWYVKECGMSGCANKRWKQFGVWSYISRVRCQVRYAVHLMKHKGHGMSKEGALEAAFNGSVEVLQTFESYAEREENRPRLQPTTKSKASGSARPVTPEPLHIVTREQARMFGPDHTIQVLVWARNSTERILNEVLDAMQLLKTLHDCIDNLHGQLSSRRGWNQNSRRGHSRPRDRDDHRGRYRPSNQDFYKAP